MLTAHLPKVNTIKDAEMQQLAEFFCVEYRRDFLNLYYFSTIKIKPKG